MGTNYFLQISYRQNKEECLLVKDRPSALAQKYLIQLKWALVEYKYAMVRVM